LLIEPEIKPKCSGGPKFAERFWCLMIASTKQRPPPKTELPDIPVVAIGASAGGLEALTAVLSALPTDIALAFVVIQHLDPKRQSILPELLARKTKIPLLEAIDAMKVESNHVYVMPSKAL